MTNEELCVKYQNGDPEAIEQLYIQNIRMIEKIIRRYRDIEDLDDLRQESFFGIVRAAELWKPDKGSFINYAVYWIKQAVRRYIDNCGGVVRVPVHKRELIGRYNRSMNSYRLKFGRDPSEKELCALLELSKNQLEDLKKDIRALKIRSTAETVGGDGDDLTLEDTIAADGDAIGDVIERIHYEQLSACIWSEVDILPASQRDVIRKRYKEGCTMKECGAALGVTPECVKSLEDKAMRELRKTKHTRRLLPFLTESGAYSAGISHNGLGMFKRYGSVQERAVMRLEQLAGMKLCSGVKLGY